MAQRTPTVTRATDSAPEPDEGLERYVVLVDAVRLTVGTKKNGNPITVQLLRGQMFRGEPEAEQVTAMLSRGSIAPCKDEEQARDMTKRHVSLMTLSRLAGVDPNLLSRTPRPQTPLG